MPTGSMHPDDAVREAKKVSDALTRAGDYLARMNEANAALHLAGQVLYSPLTTTVRAATESANRLCDHLTLLASDQRDSSQ